VWKVLGGWGGGKGGVKELGKLHIDILYNKYGQMHSILNHLINIIRHFNMFQHLKVHLQGVQLINCSRKEKMSHQI
jgi:hypothetical protein